MNLYVIINLNKEQQMSIKYLAFTLVSCALFLNDVAAKELTFTIKNIKEGQGKIYVQLFKGEDNYRLGKPDAVAIATSDDKETTLAFNNLTEGDYALRYFHDQNDNGKMDVNLMGAPQEGYGFSNNVKPSYGPVKFVDAKFSISADKITNTSDVIYGE